MKSWIRFLFHDSWGNYDLTKKINFSNYPTPRSKTSPHSFFTFLAFCFGAWASCVFTCDLLVGTETCLWRARTFCCTLYDNVERRICNFKSLRIRLHDLDFGVFLWCANSDANHGRLTGTTACCKRQKSAKARAKDEAPKHLPTGIHRVHQCIWKSYGNHVVTHKDLSNPPKDLQNSSWLLYVFLLCINSNQQYSADFIRI